MSKAGFISFMYDVLKFNSISKQYKTNKNYKK